jgi:hypothetical protein
MLAKKIHSHTGISKTKKIMEGEKVLKLLSSRLQVRTSIRCRLRSDSRTCRLQLHCSGLGWDVVGAIGSGEFVVLCVLSCGHLVLVMAGLNGCIHVISDLMFIAQ